MNHEECRPAVPPAELQASLRIRPREAAAMAAALSVHLQHQAVQETGDSFTYFI